MKKYKEQITFCIIFIITISIFYSFITMHYATDTYNIINRGYEEYAIKYSLNDGRPVMCLISLLANYMKLPIQIYIITLTIIAIFISCISVIKLKNIALKYIESQDSKKNWIVLAISYITIFNFTFLENMQFAECAVMAISVLLNIIVADIIVKKEKNYIIKSLVLTTISIIFYQGMINWLITITFVLSILKEKKINKEVIKNTILSGICIILGIIINLIQIKITGHIFDLTQTRMGNIKNIGINIKYICQNIIKILVNTYNLFPKNILLIYLVIILLYTNIFCKKIGEKINVLGIIIISIGATFSPNLITLSAFGTGRMAFSIGAMIGLLILYLCSIQKENKTQKVIQNAILLSYILLIIITYISIMREHKIVNNQDKEQAQIIGTWINEYEQETGNEIKKIVLLKDKQSKPFYDNIKNKSSLCYRSLYPDWSRLGVINYYNNRKFIEVESDKKYDKYFITKNWDKLEKEQFVFEDDTLYYCIY